MAQAIQPDKVPEELAEIHTHISETLKAAEAQIKKFEEITEANISTAEHTTFTHEPLYKAKELYAQLINDITCDETAATLSNYEDHPAAWLVSMSLIHVVVLGATVINRGAEVAESYRWVDVGLRLVETMQKNNRPFLTQEEMKIVNPKELSKYRSAAQPKYFQNFENVTSGIGAGLALELLLMGAQTWMVWGEPDYIRQFVVFSENLMDRLHTALPKDVHAAATAAVVASPSSRNVPVNNNNNNGDNNGNNNGDASSSSASPSSSALLSPQGQQLLEKQEMEKQALQVAAKSGIVSAGTEKALNEQYEAETARTFFLDRERQQQNKVVAMKLLQRRAAKSGEKIVHFEPPSWATKYFREKDSVISTTKSIWGKGELEDYRGFCEERQVDIFTALVQAFKGTTNNPISCYYSHLALQYRLPMCLTGCGRSELDEWIGLCLSLSEFYLEERDLSHLGHCLDVADTLMHHRGGLTTALSTISTYKGYKTPNGVMLMLLRLRHTAMLLGLLSDALQAEVGEGNPIKDDTTAKNVQLFQNQFLVPEEFNAAQSNGLVVDPPNWSSRYVDTKKRINLLSKCEDDNALQGLVAEPAATYQIITGAELKKLAATKLANYIEHLIPELHSALDVDEDCERFILSRRATSEFLQNVFRISKNVVVAERRLKVLDEIQNAALHENVFRNVLRQAEYDYATQSLSVAELIPKESREKYYIGAVEHLTKFCGAFEREMRMAVKSNVQSPMEGSDFTAYGLGMMRKIETLSKLDKKDESAEVAKTLIEFASKNSKEGGKNLAEMQQLATLLLAALEGKDPSSVISSVAAVSAAAKQVEKKKKSSIMSRHVDPKSSPKTMVAKSPKTSSASAAAASSSSSSSSTKKK